MTKFCESKVRTNRLHCSDCQIKIKVGEDVIFELEDRKMLNVYCPKCSDNYTQQVLEDEEHPYSQDGHGQE